MTPITDIERAYNALSGKQAAHATWWSYYDGNHPLVYSTERLREIFRHIDARFSENWCAVVIDAMLDRITLESFAVANDDAATQALNALFERTGLQLDAHDAHLATLVTGESYVMAWRDADEQPQAYYNDPLLCHAFYDPENPRVMQMAAKWWLGDDDKRHMTLYYTDRLEYYVSSQKASSVSSGKGFKPAETATEPNPFKTIPVFHFRRERRAIKSELANVVEPQNAINKLVADMMIAAEFGAFPQRYIISQSDPGTLLNAPNHNWNIPAGDGTGQQTQVGQLEAAKLDNYLAAIDKFATALAIISRTPKHYLFSQGGDPSGEALIAMEAPLNKKAQRFIDVSIPTWRELAAFLMRLSGNEVDAYAISPVFSAVETVQPKTRAEVLGLNVQAGIPLNTALRDLGWTVKELEELQKDKADEQEQAQTSLASALAEQARRFDRGEQGMNGQQQGGEN